MQIPRERAVRNFNLEIYNLVKKKTTFIRYRWL